jgi:hypothetical protein
MQARLFCPTARQTNWLLIVGFLALGEALYLRYLAIEHGQVALACRRAEYPAVHDIPADNRPVQSRSVRLVAPPRPC